MKNQHFHLAEDPRRGVALIIVLGFLSIMIIMALAFLTQSRTERLVANSSLEAQRGRQLVRTGLNAAMNDYSVELWDPSRYMLPPAGMDVFPSIPPVAAVDMGRTIGQDNIYLMVGEARRWLPRRYLTAAVTTDVANAEWILVREDPTDSHSRILGRYAYVCFDMSGGIDANLIALDSGVANVGNATNRHSVRSVGMGELTETADASTFKTLRRGWHGFDNLAELIMLTNGKYNGGEQQYEDEDDESKSWPPPAESKRRWKGDRVEFSAGLTSSEVTDLVPYSLAAYRGEWDWGGGDWKYADIQTCDGNTDWNQVLNDVNGQLVNQTDTIKALDDYVSNDPIPHGVDYPSVKNVPMFNELEMNFNLRFMPNPPTNKLFLDVTLEFETWYPFPSDDNSPAGNFRIVSPTMGGGYAVTGTEDIWMRCRLRNGKQVDLIGTPNVGELTFAADFNNGNPKSAGVISYALEVKPIVGATNTIFTPADILQIQSVKVPNPIQMELGAGRPVDQMQIQVAKGMNLAVGVPENFSYEVNDPRLNHDRNQWSESTAPTMGAINGEATAAGYGDPGGEGVYLYCRNGPMETPGEIGFISTGHPWKTIDLCTSDGAVMLSKLVSSSNIVSALQTNIVHTFYTNGTINPNTSSTNVLLAAFADLLMREVPDVRDMPGPEDGPLPQDRALDLASSIITETQSKRIEAANRGAFMAGSDWVRVPAMKKGGALSGNGLNKNQRESLIRNTWGLFSPNNSMFTVLVIGQAIKEGPHQVGIWNADDDMITGERRGVALVWRDPTPSGAAGQHEMFVRMFKFLDE